MLTATSDAQPLPRGTEHRLQQFAELVAAALANSQARADLEALADEQTALRRIAELSAQEAPADAVLQAVAVQASRLAGVEFGMVLRFVAPDGANEIVALDGAPANFTLGLRASGSGDGSVHRVWRTGRAARDRRPARDVGPMAADGQPVRLLHQRRRPDPPPGRRIVGRAHRRRPRVDAARRSSRIWPTSPSWPARRSPPRRRARSCACSPTSRPRCAASPSSSPAARRSTEVFAAIATEASKLLGDQPPHCCAMTRRPHRRRRSCNSPAAVGLVIPRAATPHRQRPARRPCATGRQLRRHATSDLARQLGVEAESPCRSPSRDASGVR